MMQSAQARHRNYGCFRQRLWLDRSAVGRIFAEAIVNSILENDLAAKRDNVCTRLGTGDSSYKEKQARRQIYLLLIRQFIRSMVVEYEYRVSFEQKANHRKER